MGHDGSRTAEIKIKKRAVGSKLQRCRFIRSSLNEGCLLHLRSFSVSSLSLLSLSLPSQLRPSSHFNAVATAAVAAAHTLINLFAILIGFLHSNPLYLKQRRIRLQSKILALEEKRLDEKEEILAGNIKKTNRTLIKALKRFIRSGPPRMFADKINANPVVYERKERRVRNVQTVIDEYEEEAIDQLEIFDHIRDIKDPEHPYSLEELKVVTEDSIELNDKKSHVRVTFTPTVEHCSMATVIGLCIRVKLVRSLPARYKIDIRVAPGTHATEAAVNKQLNDKERVAAALENPNLVEIVDTCLEPTFA